MEVTAHVHPGPFSFQHTSREEKTNDRIVLTAIDDELITHFILCSSFLGMILHTAIQNGQYISVNNLIQVGVYLKEPVHVYYQWKSMSVLPHD